MSANERVGTHPKAKGITTRRVKSEKSVKMKQSTINEGSNSNYKANLSIHNTDSRRAMSSIDSMLISQFSSSSVDCSRGLRVIQTENAIKNKNIFAIYGRSCPNAVKRALLRRGWVEKKISKKPTNSNLYSKSQVILGDHGDSITAKSCLKSPPDGALPNPSKMTSTDDLGYNAKVDKAMAAALLTGIAPNLIWNMSSSAVYWKSMADEQIVNRYPSPLFTSKAGLIDCLRNIHWYAEPGVSHTLFPRSYRLANDEERGAFIADFRLTACMGLLKWLVAAYEKHGLGGIFKSASGAEFKNGGAPPSSCVDFAVREINSYIRLRCHDDLDDPILHETMPVRWDTFLSQYKSVIGLKMKLVQAKAVKLERIELAEHAQMLYESAKRALQDIEPWWSQLGIDGSRCIWICKPGSQSQGTGIILSNDLEELLSLQGSVSDFNGNKGNSKNSKLKDPTNFRETNWVVQKYIERPLLIHNTKFDIRQWFLVTDWNPLTVWFYKECYLRFCSVPFTVKDFHKSIHLSNNSVQKHIKNSTSRSSALPKGNMWDNHTFQDYLQTTLGKPEVWDSIILPGMKEGILGVLLASQGSAKARKNSFELYGADFMLCRDFRPWLIEINSGPDMTSTTRVTKRLCPQCLEDLTKVVIDRRTDKNAETGLFELLFKQATARPSHRKKSKSAIEKITTIQGKKLFFQFRQDQNNNDDLNYNSLGQN